MKQILFLIAIATTFTSCSSNESKAKGLVKEYLQKQLNDPQSYEAVEWGKLDSSYTTFEQEISLENAEIKMFTKSYSKAVDDMTIDVGNHEAFAIDKADAEMYKQKVDSLQSIIDKKKLNFKPTFEGFKISHTYRAKNLMAALGLHTSIFFFDKEFKLYTSKKED